MKLQQKSNIQLVFLYILLKPFFLMKGYNNQLIKELDLQVFLNNNYQQGILNH